MRVIDTLAAFALLSCSGIQSQANAADVCKGYGPQTPRDITSGDLTCVRLSLPHLPRT